jgi:hypothetical protein
MNKNFISPAQMRHPGGAFDPSGDAHPPTRGHVSEPLPLGVQLVYDE